MIYDYSQHKVGDKLISESGREYTIIKVTSNSLTLNNMKIVQMYSDGFLYYYYYDKINRCQVFKNILPLNFNWWRGQVFNHQDI